jgi:hypothetical protein
MTSNTMFQIEYRVMGVAEWISDKVHESYEMLSGRANRIYNCSNVLEIRITKTEVTEYRKRSKNAAPR